MSPAGRKKRARKRETMLSNNVSNKRVNRHVPAAISGILAALVFRYMCRCAPYASEATTCWSRRHRRRRTPHAVPRFTRARHETAAHAKWIFPTPTRTRAGSAYRSPGCCRSPWLVLRILGGAGRLVHWTADAACASCIEGRWTGDCTIRERGCTYSRRICGLFINLMAAIFTCFARAHQWLYPVQGKIFEEFYFRMMAFLRCVEGR